MAGKLQRAGEAVAALRGISACGHRCSQRSKAMMKAAMKAWMERKQDEELFIEEVGLIAGVPITSAYTHSCPRMTIWFTWQVAVAKGPLV